MSAQRPARRPRAATTSRPLPSLDRVAAGLALGAAGAGVAGCANPFTAPRDDGRSQPAPRVEPESPLDLASLFATEAARGPAVATGHVEPPWRAVPAVRGDARAEGAAARKPASALAGTFEDPNSAVALMGGAMISVSAMGGAISSVGVAPRYSRGRRR